MFFTKAQEDFKVQNMTPRNMELAIKLCAEMYHGKPVWVSDEDHVKTVNFAKSVCSEVSRLAVLESKITITGSKRADWLQTQADLFAPNLRHWVEYGAAYGTVILKPSYYDGMIEVQVVTQDNFTVTQQTNGKITGIVFEDHRVSEDGRTYYTREEYHQCYPGGKYVIRNKFYMSKSEGDIGKPVDADVTPWAGLQEEVVLENVYDAMFAVLRMPGANSVDVNSPLGMPIFYDALEELHDLDVAYSRMTYEIKQSKRIVLLDSDRMMTGLKGTKVTYDSLRQAKVEMDLPDYVRNVEGSGIEDFYQEINPTLNTKERVDGINALLSQIGYKCGFSNGAFVFDQKTGLLTATQVEADNQRTVQLIQDVRYRVEEAIKQLIYSMSVLADLYSLSPYGKYNAEDMLHFSDILVTHEADKQACWNYVVQGVYPFYRYLMRFENMSEEEAKKIVEEAKEQQDNYPTLFGDNINGAMPQNA